MAAKILEELDNVEISLEKVDSGIFDVHVDAMPLPVFSKLVLKLDKVDDVKPEDVVEKIQEYKKAVEIEKLAKAAQEKCQ